MPNFVHTIPLNNRNLRIKCRELDFITYKNLTKTIYNDSAEDIDTYVDEVLHDLIVNDDPTHFDIIDKFIILGHLRDINISGEFQLQTECEVTKKQYTLNVNLEDVLETLNKIKLKKEYTATSGNTTINFQLPKSFNYTSLVDTYGASIQSVGRDGGDNIVIPNYVDKSELLDKLPVSLMNDFKRFLDHQTKILNDIVLFKYRSPHSPESVYNEYRFSFYDTASLDLLKLLFQEDLYQLYEFEYDLYHICNLPYDVVRNSTFSELQLLYNIEAKRQSESEPKEQQ